MTQLQMKTDIIEMPEGAKVSHHVRVVLQYGPVAAILVLPPEAMAGVCEQFAEVVSGQVAQARRMDVMQGFQIVSGDALPILPPMDKRLRPDQEL